MVEASIEEILSYGFALFFVFTVVVMILLRYSNKFLLSKISETKQNFAEELGKIDNEMRKLVLANAREKKELSEEIEKLKELHHLHGHQPKAHQKKVKAVA